MPIPLAKNTCSLVELFAAVQVGFDLCRHLHVQVPESQVVKPTRTTPAKRRQQLDQAQKQREELAALQEQLSGLQGKLLEKDEALRSAENLIGRISAANEAVDELRSQLSEKESVVESTGSELQDTKVYWIWLVVCAFRCSLYCQKAVNA